MTAMTATAREARPFWARLGALVCLFAWFAGTPSLLPEAIAALGRLDSQHRVQVEQSAGKVAVVFHHEGSALTPAHRHSPLAIVLTAFARNGTSTPDHVFTFAQTKAASLRTAFVLPAATAAELPPLAETFILLPPPQTAAEPNLAARPPLPCAFALVCLRSTTLLV